MFKYPTLTLTKLNIIFFTGVNLFNYKKSPVYKNKDKFKNPIPRIVALSLFKGIFYGTIFPLSWGMIVISYLGYDEHPFAPFFIPYYNYNKYHKYEKCEKY